MTQQKAKVSAQLEQTITPILEILDTAMAGSIELLQRLYNGDMLAVHTLVDDLQQVLIAVDRAQQPVLGQLEHAYTTEMIGNLVDTLEEMGASLHEPGLGQAKHLAEYQLLPFFRLLRESFYFWGTVYPDPERMRRYDETEFAQHYCSPYFDPDQPARFQVSIVVSAYNHLETTKKCVEHILKYVDFRSLQAELILIDHGSTDGTLEYFRSIPHAKVVHFKHNVRMYMIAAMPMLSEGKYMNLVSNDILVTKNWLNNLIACMESDERIALAVPITPNIANLQMMRQVPSDPEEFVRWADGFNHSDPSLWSDRARLLPPIGLFRMSALCALGLADPYFYSMEFWDDDFSLRARRNGYRQVLCEDTACYHFGSMTVKKAQQKEGTLEYGRELFLARRGVDAWCTGFCYDYTSIKLFLRYLPRQDTVNLLGIDCGFGDTPLQMRNELRHLHRDCTIWNLTVQPEYAPDLQPYSDYFALERAPVPSALQEAFPNQRFEVIYLERNAAEYSNIGKLFQAVGSRLSEGGYFLFKTENPWHILNIYTILQLSLPSEQVTWIQPNALKAAAEQVFSEVQVVHSMQKVEGAENFIRQHYDASQQKMEQITETLSIKTYYFICRK